MAKAHASAHGKKKAQWIPVPSRLIGLSRSRPKNNLAVRFYHGLDTKKPVKNSVFYRKTITLKFRFNLKIKTNRYVQLSNTYNREHFHCKGFYLFFLVFNKSAYIQLCDLLRCLKPASLELTRIKKERVSPQGTQVFINLACLWYYEYLWYNEYHAVAKLWNWKKVQLARSWTECSAKIKPKKNV